MLKSIISSLVVGLCLVASVQAQPETLWSRTYVSEYGEFGWTVINCIEGGYALFGYAESNDRGISDFWMVRTNEDGGLALSD